MRKVVIFGMIILLSIHAIAQTYNPGKAVEYADEWWNKRNTNSADAARWGGPYYDYDLPQNGGGGDCANFVSQCLIYGGLNLSKGTNGSGAGVKPEGTITGVQNLVTHLKNYQNTEHYPTANAANEADVFSKTDLGDPVFGGGGSNNYTHSLICTKVDGSKNYYSAHSSDYHNEEYSLIWNYQYAHYFHIKSSKPDHCSNCILDGDETDVDCGGSCPPCEKAKKTVSYTSNTSFLPRVTRAVESIVAGDANVRILPGQHVEFHTTGSIILKPGFVATQGSTFIASRKKMRKDLGADCESFCAPIRMGALCFNLHDAYYWYIYNASRISYTIYQRGKNGGGAAIYSCTMPLLQEGKTKLWDGRQGVMSCLECTDVFHIEATIIDCNGNSHFYSNAIYTGNNCSPAVSANESSYTQGDIVADYALENLNDTFDDLLLHPNPNNGTFTIHTNFDIQEIENIQVVSPLGNVIFEQNTFNSQISIPNPTAGMYFLIVTLKDKIITRKFVIQ